MQKRKFELSADIIDVKNDEKKYNLIDSEILLNKDISVKNVSMKALTIKIPKKLHTEFKIWCAKNSILMSDAFVKFYEFYKGSDH